MITRAIRQADRLVLGVGAMLAVFGLSMSSASAGTIYAVQNTGLPGNGNTEYLVTVDPATGAVTRIGAGSSQVLSASTNSMTIDAAGGRYYFMGLSSPPTPTLFAFDLQTGQLAVQRSLSALVSNPRFDSATGRLYAFQTTGPFGSTTQFLTTINPVTGAVTHVGGGTTAVQATQLGTAVIDSTARRYYIEGFSTSTPSGNPKLFAFNLDTGSLVSQVQLTAAANDLVLTSTTGGLFGFTAGGGPGGTTFLEKIDPLTGLVTRLGSGSTALPNGVSLDGVLYDPTRRVIYAEGVTGPNSRVLVPFSELTGDAGLPITLSGPMTGLEPFALAVPEPGSIALFATALVVLGAVARRRGGLAAAA